MHASLQTRVLYGLKTDIESNAHYIADAEILYPVGNVIAVHNIPQRRQRLIRLPEKHQINIICVPPNKKYVAVCEVGEKPTICIYDLQTLRRKKSLGIPYEAFGVTKFTCISFTHDSKYLAAVTAEPDQTMLFYNWEKGKVESSIKLGNPQNPLAVVEVLACNPSDAGVIAVGGPRVFKFLTVSETVWRPYGFSKADNISICSMTWLNADRLLFGTKDGRIFYLENGDLKNVYKMTETVSMNFKIREEYVIQGSTSTTTLLGKDENEWENNIRCLTGFHKGFAYAFGVGTVILFEKDGQHKYVKRNIYTVPLQTSKNNNQDLYRINTLNINLSFDRLIVTTGWPQLFYASLWGTDLNMDPEPQKMKIMGQPLHSGPITGLSMCVWKPIFMTCGETDQTVRLWDFEAENLVLLKQYTEEICSIALHPTGLFCLIGFSDKLRFMNILIDDLQPLEEFPIRNCRIVKFSHSGHLFAAVNENYIQVYTTIGFYNSYVLRGHTGRIKALIWSQADMKLLTLGSEGAIYQWDMSSGERFGEIILRGIDLYDIGLAFDETVSYCIANDNCIREIKENAVSRQYNLAGIDMYSMVLGRESDVLFLICPGGIILSVKYPLQEPVTYTDFHVHSVDITKAALTYNEQYLVSTAMDGSLCIWKVQYPERKVGAVSKILTYTNEVLISKADLVEKIQLIKDLTARLRELETEHAYKMRQLEVLHNDKIREIHKGYSDAIEELRDRIDKLQEDHKNELNTINVEIVKIRAAHEETMKQVEVSYHAKLIVEYDKCTAIEEHCFDMRQNYEKRLENLEKLKAEEIQKLTSKYEALLHEKKLQLEEAQDEMTHQERVHKKLTVQIEDDADQEILQVRTNYESLLYDEKQMNLKLKGEAGVMRNKYIASQKDISDLKRQLQRMQGEYEHFQKSIQGLEKDVAELKKEISERDDAIQDRENQIYDLKRTNQELEKFKFVLNYKIQELKNQIEPRDQEIVELKQKIHNMEMELVNLHKTNVSLELQLHELREKLRASRGEMQAEMRYSKKCQQVLKRIRVDLLDAAGHIQEPHVLKAAIVKLYHKHSSDDEFLRSRKADLDAQCEFETQRDHLERTVASLKKQVLHDSARGNKDADKMIGENILLITELNALREQLKDARKHILHMESLFGLSAKGVKPDEAKIKLQKACYGYEELHKEYKTKMQECQQINATLKTDIQRLLDKLSCQELKERRVSF